MPMEKETVAELTAQCRKALKKPLKFAYFPNGPEDEPVLVIDKNIMPKLKELKKTAKKKKFSTGTVQKGEKGLEFLPEKDPGKLKQHLKSVFAKQVPLLKGATIVLDAAVETGESDAEETPTAPSTPSPQTAPAPPPPQAASGNALKEELARSRDEIKTLAAELSSIGSSPADLGKLQANLTRLKALRTQLAAQRASLQATS